MTTDHRPIGVVRITLTNADGTVEEIEVTEDLHFFLGFATCGPDGGKNVPAEILVSGDSGVLGKILFRLGERHPELRDPGAETFRNAPVFGGVQ
jgi:hypothetical protein